MAEGKLLKAWGAGCARQMIIAILTMFIMAIGIACLIAVVELVPASEETRMLLGLGGFLLLSFAMLGGVAVWGVWTLRKRANQLDTVFLPLGLNGRSYLTNGRQYHGLVRGRQTDVYFYRGPILDIYVAAPLRTRVGIGLQSRLSTMAASIVKRTPLDTGDPALAGLAIYPSDLQWCSELLADPQVRSILPRLMSEQGWFEFHNLIIQPEAIQLQMHGIQVRQITPEAVQRWVSDLVELAQIAERLPAPSRVETPTPMEQRTRLNRDSFTLPAVLITLGILGALTLCGIGAAVAIFFIERAGY